MSYRAALVLAAALPLLVSLQSARGAAPVQFTRQYAGSLGGEYPVRLTLRRYDDRLHGFYRYEGRTEVLAVSGEVDTAGRFTMHENDPAGEETGVFTGSVKPDTLEGTWSRPDGTGRLPFTLKQASHDPPGSLHGDWSWPKSEAHFSIELLQTGSHVEGFYDAITRNATRLDTDSPVWGTVEGDVARVRWRSGYSGITGTAVLTRRKSSLTWEVKEHGQGDFWAPMKTTLKKLRRKKQ